MGRAGEAKDAGKVGNSRGDGDEEMGKAGKVGKMEKMEKTGKARKAGTIGKAGKVGRGSTEGAVTGRPLDSGAPLTGMWLVTVWMCEQWHDSL